MAVKNAPKKSVRKPTRRSTRKVVVEAATKPVRSASATPMRKAAKRPAKVTTKIPVNRATKTAAKRTVKPPAKKASKAAAKKATNAPAKKTATIRARVTSKAPAEKSRVKLAPKAAEESAVMASVTKAGQTKGGSPADREGSREASAAKKSSPISARSARKLEKKKALINEKIRGLIRLSKEQGYLTFTDINKALPDSVNSPEEIENVISILENLEVDIIDSDDVERYKQRLQKHTEEELKSSQLDILDDPVRMYLKQMGQVPLLTREQEVAISKRIEAAELKAQNELFSVGLTTKFQIGLARRLINRDERFDRIVLDNKIESRENYFKSHPRLIDLCED